MCKNEALAKLKKYKSGASKDMRVEPKRTAEQVAADTSQLGGTGDEVVNEYETNTQQEELKSWLLWRSSAIALGFVLLLVLALHFKIIKF